MNKLPLVFILLAIIASSCKNKIYPHQSLTTTFPSESISPLNIEGQNVDFKYFNAKSSFAYKDEDDDLNANANIRMKKDSIIWINVSAGFGIEAMRGIVTPDSIVIVDKIKKKYVVYSFDDLSNKYNFKIDFLLLQNILLGNFSALSSDSLPILKHPSYIVINQKLGKTLIESFLNKKTLKLDRLVISEPSTPNIFTVDYSSFTMLNNNSVIPFKISFDLDYFFEKKKYNISVDIAHEKAEFSEKGIRFPFSIPEKYERSE